MKLKYLRKLFEGVRKTAKKRLKNAAPERTIIQMVTERGNGFYAWNGKLYQSDIVRACIRPKVKAVGKLAAKHIRDDGTTIKTNPDAYMRFLLEEPNPYMSGQIMQEKIATQLALNNNAFTLIIRDNLGYPCQLYPIPCVSVEALYESGALHLKFYFLNGKQLKVPYTEVIHLRDDFNDNDIFGESPAKALTELMTIASTIDQGIVKAIKNSGVIRWLLKFNQSLRPEDLEANVKNFADTYLSVESDTFGAAGVDNKVDAVRIEPKDFVPNALQMDKTTQRIYAFFNTNEKIVHSSYNEDEWNAYYEAQIEPLALQMRHEYTRKLFTRRERGFGNYITFDASNLSCASITTKLALQAMVDRSALTPNEWRATFNLAPKEGGDEPLRRLDTQTVTEAQPGGGVKDGQD